MRVLDLTIIVVLISSLVPAPVSAGQRSATPNPGESIALLSPKADDNVDETVTIIGRIHAEGQPIVLVRPAVAGSSWWIQTAPVEMEKGFFRTTVRLGNETTPAGSRFYLVAALLSAVADASHFIGRTSVEQLPESVPLSQITTVTFQQQVPVVKSGGSILRPEAKQVVGPHVEVLGRMTAPGQPVILVRASTADDRWWVQQPAQVDGRGNFRAAVRLGNQQTEDGTKFRVVMLSLDPRQAAALLAAESIFDLPPGIPRSNEVEVILARGIANLVP